MTAIAPHQQRREPPRPVSLHLDTGFWYIGTPYSRYLGGIDEAFTRACEITAAYISQGIPVFSPIVHSHPVAIVGQIDHMAHEIWLPVDRPFMEAAHGLIVAMLPGWATSKGLNHEIDYFTAAGKPVVFTDPFQA